MRDREDDIFSLVVRICTTGQIKELLRRAEGHVRLSAANIEELVQRNLRDAVRSKALSLGQVYALIREAEEKGRHHVFYFKSARILSPDSISIQSIGKKLLGTKWASRLPNFKTEKNKFTYADLYPSDPAGKPQDWVLKVYGGMEVERFTGAREDGNRVYKEFLLEELRVVLLARWNSPDLLELRVPRNDSRRRITTWLRELWAMLAPAIDFRNFTPWNLSQAYRYMIAEESQHRQTYVFRDTRLRDESFNTYSFQSPAVECNLFDSGEARKAIDDVLTGESVFTDLTVSWLPSPDDVPTREYQTFLGGSDLNEVVFLDKSSMRESDYVTEKLRLYREIGTKRGSRHYERTSRQSKMLRDFDALAAEHPELAPAFVQLRAWILERPDLDVLDPRSLARSLRRIDSVSLAVTLQLLVRKGILRQRYTVATPSGALADEQFDDPRRIPSRLTDRSNRHFDTAGAEIVPILVTPRN